MRVDLNGAVIAAGDVGPDRFAKIADFCGKLVLVMGSCSRGERRWGRVIRERCCGMGWGEKLPLVPLDFLSFMENSPSEVKRSA